MKRERINSAESELNNDGLLPLVDDMLEMRKQAAERINAMFGTDITVEKASAWEFRQLAAEVDAANPEGTEDNPESDQEEAPAEPDQEEAREEDPEEEKKEDDEDDGTEKTE